MAGTTAVSPESSREEVHDSAPVAVASSPKEPTQQEREEHVATHLPHHCWCKLCVRGRGRSEAHKQLQADKSHAVPHVSMDCRAAAKTIGARPGPGLIKFYFIYTCPEQFE